MEKIKESAVNFPVFTQIEKESLHVVTGRVLGVDYLIEESTFQDASRLWFAAESAFFKLKTWHADRSGFMLND